MNGHWVKWIRIPDGCDENTLLGLRCTKQNYVYPVGKGRNAIQQVDGGFFVLDDHMHTLETHALTCGCEFEVVPFSL